MAPLNKSSSFSSPSSNSRTLTHFTHPNHPLQLLDIPEEFICGGCNALGFGTRYRCNPCGFNLHEYCATCPHTIPPSSLHPDHPLTLVNQMVNKQFCKICGDSVGGVFYTCRVCDFHLHPLCTQLPLHTQQPFHQHVLKLEQGNPAGCTVCFKTCTIFRYRCEECRVDVHLECILGETSTDTSKTRSLSKSCTFQSPQHATYVGTSGGGGYNSYAMMQQNPPYYGGGHYNTQQSVPYYNHGGYNPYETSINQPSKAQGQTGGVSKKRKIYSVVRRLATTVVLNSMGIPYI